MREKQSVKLPPGWREVSGLKHGLKTIETEMRSPRDKAQPCFWLSISEDLTMCSGTGSIHLDVYLNLIRSVNADPVYALAKKIVSPCSYEEMFDAIDKLRELITSLDNGRLYFTECNKTISRTLLGKLDPDPTVSVIESAD